MPIISPIGRKSKKTRLLLAAMYLTLILGAITMIYPFLLMLSGSTKSAVDIKTLDLIPAFITNDTLLYQKHIEALFNEQLNRMQITYDTNISSFQKIQPLTHPPQNLLNHWYTFSKNLPPTTWELGYLRAPDSKTSPLMLRKFKHHLHKKYTGDIQQMNQHLGTEFINWNAFVAPREDYLPRFQNPPDTPFEKSLITYRQKQPKGYHIPFIANGYYKHNYLQTQYTKDIQTYNKTHHTHYTSYDQIQLSPTYPQHATKKEQHDWEQFMRHTLNLLWITIHDSALPTYQNFLQAKYTTIQTLNKKHHTQHPSFSDIPLPKNVPHHGIIRSDWAAFITGWQDPDTKILYQPKATTLRINSIDLQFRDYLRQQKYPNYATASIPIQAAHQTYFDTHKKQIRHEFLIRNFATVLDYLLIHGRGIRNTIIYCLLAVLSALIVNPMAAYAMSRYALPATYKILLFMLLTMAFPPMVTQIPTFLMLRDLNLLNTFAALILPGLAHGYSIFLLKGFFDSLPRELYESAQIDGANEWTMFWNISMALSKPILAVIALQAFNMAYSNFMFALLFCQDQDMWTIMVWLYQLQSTSGQAVIYASLLIAAIPTFIIFAFCQNIIMRGIVVPVEK